MESEIVALNGSGLTSVDIGDEFRQLNSAITDLAGLASSIRAIGATLPVTTLTDEEDTLCPELVFPSLGKEMMVKVNECLSRVERLENLLPRALRN